jgi:ABC-type phosphate transport system substrate-binding protein
LNDYNSEIFPAQVAAGSLAGGTVYTIYSAGTTNWTAVGAYANMTGITFTATGAGSGTGTAVLATVNPDVIATFGNAAAANTYAGQPNPIVTIASA